VVGLDAVGLLERVVVLVPDNLGLGDAEDVALDLATVDADQVDLGRGLDELCKKSGRKWVVSELSGAPTFNRTAFSWKELADEFWRKLVSMKVWEAL
jgi:hypothetical protein